MPKKSPAVVYVGTERFQQLAKIAREISYLTDSTVTTGAFLHYLIDEFQDQAHSTLLHKKKKQKPNPN